MNQAKVALKLPGTEPRQGATAPSSPDLPVGARLPAWRMQPCGETLHLSLHGDVQTLEAEWRRFEQTADCTVFQSWAWLSTWQRHVGERQGTRPVLVAGRDDRGELLLVLPLAVERHGLVRTLTWWGSDNSDYNAPLLAPNLPQMISAADFLALWQHIVQRIQSQAHWRFDVMAFVRMPARVGQQPHPFIGLPVSPHPDHAYLTQLAGDWEHFYASKRSPATRRRDRTKRNRLSALGTIDFVTPKQAGEIRRSMDELIAQKTLSFASMGARNIFLRPGWAAFYCALATDHSASGLAHVSRLDVGRAAGAINLGLVFKGTYYHLLASHAGGDMARFSPGAAHLHELMRTAIARACTVYDFTIGDESYKRDWSDTKSVLFDHVSAVRVRGLPTVWLLRLQRRLKRFVKQTPRVWNAFTRWRARLATPTRQAQPSTPSQERS